MSVAGAMLRRDARIAWSYRFSFLVQTAGLGFSLLMFRFIGDLVSTSDDGPLADYGGDYFSFAMLGIAVNFLAYPAVRSFASAIRGSQVTGTFEAMLATRAHPVALVLSTGIYPLLVALLQVVVLALIGIALGARLQVTEVATLLLVIGMTVATFAGIGLASAAFAIAFQQREPFTGAFLAASVVVSGAFYPTSVLPAWLEALSPLLPTTHAIALVRGLMLEGDGPADAGLHLSLLAAFTLALPAGGWAVLRALAIARRRGSLGHY